jgi:GTP-binding protein EngB required for normal cell division
MSARSSAPVAASDATDDPPIDGAADAVRRALGHLIEAADAASALGIPTDRVRAAHEDASRRLGFPSDAYVLALVGGTGVGKSSLLNALAGSTVSVASARRPTTSDPIAWVPASERRGLGPVLEWLEVAEIREHEADGLGPVAILDLPDMDSVTPAHRARVEAVLPRVDAVVWVTDLEKYADAVLHDEFLRKWVPRLRRQAVVVNKVDRLAGADRPRVRRDLEADLERRLPIGNAHPVPVLLTTAQPTADLEELRTWLADGASAKVIARGRVRATVDDLAVGLARDAGMEPGRPAPPFLSDAARSAAVVAASEAVLRAIDLEGLERQAIAATRARARARGAGPLGGLTSLAYRLSGRETKVASPSGFLMRWRDHGPLTPAVEALRRALGSALEDASPRVRPRLAAALEPGPLRQGLEQAMDQAVAGIGRLEAPTSRWWSILGLLQTLATLAIAVSVAWVVLWVMTRTPVESVDLPVIGLVPMPFVALVVTLFVGYALARLLGLHAGWVGRRWARRVRARVTTAVRDELTERGLAPLDALEDARRRLATAVSAILGES